MDIKITPTHPSLSDSDTLTAFECLNKPCILKVVRTLVDPPIVDQKIGMFSFIPHKEAKPSPNGRFGYLKLRGNFSNANDAKHYAYNLVKNLDSYNEIYHVRVGAFIPIGPKFDGISDVDEVHLNTEMTESISQRIDEKRKEDATKIAEIEAQTKILRDESSIPIKDPLDEYIERRVKYATLKLTYLEHEKKIEEIKGLLERVKRELDTTDCTNPEYREQYFEKYKQAYEKAGLDTQKPSQMSEMFMKFIQEDVILPF